MYALVIKALKVRPVVRRKFWFHYQISATWTWRVTTTIFLSRDQSLAVWPSSLGAAYTFGVSSLLPRCLCQVAGKERVRLSRWRHSSCNVESRIGRAENAMGLGLSPILGVPGAVSLVKKIFKNGQERGEPLGCYSYRTSSTTSSNTCLCFGHKNNQRPASIYRAAFVIFLHKGVDLQTRLLPLRPC